LDPPGLGGNREDPDIIGALEETDIALFLQAAEDHHLISVRKKQT
jgi:hypothetical protein